MDRLRTHSRTAIIWLLVIPTLAWCYIGLFVTMQLWYPAGLPAADFRAHIFHFTLIYVMWLAVYFIYTLFDLETFRTSRAVVSRLIGATIANSLIAVAYFYFQPALIITPRRFLLVHVVITTVGLAIWYALVQYLLPRGFKRPVYLHPQVEQYGIAALIADQGVKGLQLAGTALPEDLIGQQFISRPLVVLPASLEPAELKTIFSLRRAGVDFIEYDMLHERLTRTIHLNALTDVWFLRHVDYGHRFYDIIKRGLDIIIGAVGVIILSLLLPFLAVAIKLDSRGSVFFSQERIGKDGVPFRLYKLRTMSGAVTDSWTDPGDRRITTVGKWLRMLRLDELPQFWNILKGDMSLVGPRPEQVAIVAALKEQIPYYDERHSVNPGLTGWAQLHVYASNLEETRRKLQFDLYYVKARSFIFDWEIILRTIYRIITFAGR